MSSNNKENKSHPKPNNDPSPPFAQHVSNLQLLTATQTTQINRSLCCPRQQRPEQGFTFMNHPILLEISPNPNVFIHAFETPLMETILASHSRFGFMRLSSNEHNIGATFTTTIVHWLTERRLTKHPKFPELFLVEEGEMVVCLFQ